MQEIIVKNLKNTKILRNRIAKILFCLALFGRRYELTLNRLFCYANGILKYFFSAYTLIR